MTLLSTRRHLQLSGDSAKKSMVEEFYRTKKKFISDDPRHQIEYESMTLNESIQSQKSTLENHLNRAIEQHHYEEADRLNRELMELENQITQAQIRSFGEQFLEQQKVTIMTERSQSNSFSSLTFL